MITWRLLFEPRDLWIGLYWDYKPLAYDDGKGVKFDASGDQAFLQMAASLGVASVPPRPRLDLWLCLCPCLPLHLTWWGERATSPEEASWANQGGPIGPYNNLADGTISVAEFKAGLDRSREEMTQHASPEGRRLKLWPAGDPEPPPESMDRILAKVLGTATPENKPSSEEPL